MNRLHLGSLVVGISCLAGPHFSPHTMGAPPAAPGVAGGVQAAQPAADSEPSAFSAQAKALPFPPDAREVEFDATFNDIEFTSRSSLASLAGFYRRQMQKRGWNEDASAAVQEEDSAEMTFKHNGAQVLIELEQSSDDTVDVSMDCEGLDFAGTDDPASLLAARVPQPRSYLYLQKEIPRPEGVRDLEYRSDECHFKSPIGLQAAFDYYRKTLKDLGWRESRRPIVTGDRRYTEFKRGPITVSVNIFSDDVGSRIILGYEDERQEAVVPPLPAAPSAALPEGARESAGGGRAHVDAKPAVDASTNTGSATVREGGDQYVFKHVAAYQTKHGGNETTTLVFSDRPIPLQRMQAMLAAKDDFSFGDLFESALPSSLRIQVNGSTSFSFNAQSVVIGDAIEDPEGEIKLEQGRVRGTIRMRQPKDAFGQPFHLTARIDAAVLTPHTRLRSAADPPLVSPRQPPFPNTELLLPEGASDVRSHGTRYRKSSHATVDMEPQAIADFYRAALAAQHWKEDEKARVWPKEGDETIARATLLFRSTAGTMRIELRREEHRTVVDVTHHDQAKARRDGVLPEAGKARIIMGNAHSRDVVISIGKQDYPLKAGRGAQDPKAGLNYSVAPGAYVVTIRIPGEQPQTRRLDIASGTAWGVMALPTGGYIADQLY